jgi:ATP-dependent DNA helicase DinG
MGLDRIEPLERVEVLRVDSPFDFDHQARLLVPTDLPEPGLPGYEPATHLMIGRALDITQGGTLLLFTSHGSLNRAHTALAQKLLQVGLTPLRQGELRRHLLLTRLREDRKAVLFATDSFWEGIDIKGNALRCVIITRLPFKVPTEPIEQARVETIEERGGNAFFEHAVPQAVLRLKQGFGRLIRSRGDRGCVLILDSRIARKRYGRVFLNSLPPARLTIGTNNEVLDSMHGFFTQQT